MNFGALVNWFLPEPLKSNSLHTRYDETHTLVTSCIIGAVLLPLIYLLLLFAGYQLEALLYNGLLCLGLLFASRSTMSRIPVYITGLLTYAVYFPYIVATGGVYSSLVGFLYLYLVGAYWGHRNSGLVATGLNLLVLILLFYKTPESAVLTGALRGPVSTLFVHISGTSLLGLLLWMVMVRQDKAREQIKQLQNRKIEHLDAEVAKHNEQLNTIRESLARDFHDETGNMLSAITVQASMLKLRIPQDDPTRPMVDSIISNSNELYASTRHFLWNLNNSSQRPLELFEYLTGFAQSFYNQFDISFSSRSTCNPDTKLDPFIALNLIFIFKEAMNNVVRHSGASEVLLEMHCRDEQLELSIADNGSWKTPGENDIHHGINNMRRRSEKYQLRFNLFSGDSGTKIQLILPSILKQI